MQNASIIKLIEYQSGDTYESIDFQFGSAEYDYKRSRTAQGYLYKHSLAFKVPGLNSDTDWMLRRVVRTRSIRFEDVQGRIRYLGSEDIRLAISVDEIIEGKPGGFRGYKVSVDWNSIRRDATESFI